jgi:hypothetical protein
LSVDVFPDAPQLAVSNRDGEDPVVLERLVRGFDFSPREADDQDPVSLRCGVLDMNRTRALARCSNAGRGQTEDRRTVG